MTRRIPANRTLADILPAGAEGGNEFGRIVDLLLFHDARRQGQSATLLNDAAGDYAGLDSIARSMRVGTTGYQYKFFKSPLTPKHRQSIEKSLKAALSGAVKSGIDRWILVTPEDLVESATRTGGGDVSWFLDLQKSASSAKIDLQHWGHKQLQALFVQTPSLALFYYPSLVPYAAAQTKTLREILSRYETNIFATYGKIQFVGMSVYKPEATKGIALNDIYIPLKLLPEGADEDALAIAAVNPLVMLEPGSQHVVLGDPGIHVSLLRGS